jgi:hypothetical protein
VNVVPVQGHGQIEGPGPICCDCVHFFEGCEEVNGVIVVDVFDSKIVNDQLKRDIPGGVGP